MKRDCESCGNSGRVCRWNGDSGGCEKIRGWGGEWGWRGWSPAGCMVVWGDEGDDSGRGEEVSWFEEGDIREEGWVYRVVSWRGDNGDLDTSMRRMPAGCMFVIGGVEE